MGNAQYLDDPGVAGLALYKITHGLKYSNVLSPLVSESRVGGMR